jgi:GT2 family glycosyltransferase
MAVGWLSLDDAAVSRPAGARPAGMHPRVAVVVLNWNGWRDTVRCVRSLEASDYPNYEVVVVDNGSDDGSPERLREMCPAATVLAVGQNLGFAGGNNRGIRHALRSDARYVWVLNNDTVVDRQALATMVKTAEADPAVGAVGAVIWTMDGARVLAWGGGDVDLRGGRSWYVVTPHERLTYITGASMLLKTAALQDAGLFDERFFLYWEDTDLSWRLRRAGWTVRVAPDARVWHQESSTVGQDTYMKARHFTRGLVLFLRKHTPVPLVPAVRALRRELYRARVRRRADLQRGVARGWVEGWLA